MKHATILLILFFVANIFADDAASSRQEAERFAQESRFLAQQGRYEAAMEKAETAAALDPENDAIKGGLVDAIFTHASDMLYPGEKRGHRPINRLVDSNATIDQVRKALELANRGWSVATTLSNNDFAAIYERERHLRLAWLREKLWTVAERQFPELENEVRTFNRKTTDHWIEHRYRLRVSPVTDKNSAHSCFDPLLLEAANRVFRWQSPDDLALPYEMIVKDILRLDAQFQTGCTESTRAFLVFFAETTAKRKSLPEEQRGRSGDVLFERTITALESNPRLAFRLFGWIARNNVVPKPSGRGRDPRPAQRYFLVVKERLEKLPTGIPYADYSILYDELDRIVEPCNEASFQVSVSSPIRSSDSYSLRFGILDLAESRNEIATSACQSLIRWTPDDEERVKSNAGRYPRTEALVARSRIRIAGHILAAKKIDPKIADSLRQRAIAAFPDVSFETKQNNIATK